jgi:histidinol phosphatase-like enzyme (inositol monophosphatase family)
MTIDSASLMEAAADVARLAGNVANGFFQHAIDVELKSDHSPVTAADRAAERAARDWIARRFPGDRIVGEEFGESAAHADRAWFIDPIDGTRTFVRGVPLWGTLVGVAVDGQVIAGAAYFPALDEMLHAGIGAGCWWNGALCRVSSVSTLADAAVVTTDDQFRVAPQYLDSWRELASRAGLSRTWGDCYGYLLVVTGRAEVMADGKLAGWDAAPFFPALAEAGGVLTDWNGNPTPFGGSAIATNAALAAEVRSILIGRDRSTRS